MSGVRGKRLADTYSLLKVADEIVPVLPLFQPCECHLGARDVLYTRRGRSASPPPHMSLYPPF